MNILTILQEWLNKQVQEMLKKGLESFILKLLSDFSYVIFLFFLGKWNTSTPIRWQKKEIH